MKPHTFSKASTDWTRALCLSHPWRRQICMQLSSQGDPLSWGPFLPSRWHRQPATSSAVLSTKGVFGTWQCLGLAVAAACFGFCSFSDVLYYLSVQKDKLGLVVCCLKLGYTIQTRGSWSRVSWISGVLEIMLSWLTFAWSAPSKLMGRGKIGQLWGWKSCVMSHTQLFPYDPRIAWWIYPGLKSCKGCEYTEEVQWDKYHLHHCANSVYSTLVCYSENKSSRASTPGEKQWAKTEG